MRLLLLVLSVAALVLGTSCKKKHQKEDPRPKGKLCLAANPADLFRWKQDGVEVDFTEGQPLVFKYRGKAIALPNDQIAFDDAREGEAFAVMRGDKLVESWKVNWKLGKDLCYAFRTFDPAKPDRKPKFILNVNEPDDRCTCY